MPSLELVRAGAGSGKTFDLCKTVAEAVEAGLDPARILATTFTKRAAAELKGRIQTKLLSSESGQGHQHADRLELAAIGTVHSVAHRLLSRYAIEMGLSPRLEVITEDARDRALADLMGKIPFEEWQPLADCAERLGITDLHLRVLSLLAAKRGNAIENTTFRSDMAASADRVCELLASEGISDSAPPLSQLYDLADNALAALDALTHDTTNKTDDAKQKLRQLKSKRISLWGSYLVACRITAGKRSGADSVLDDLRNHASQIRQNPHLHEDVRDFSRRLADETIRLEQLHADFKTERGLVDYTDLETLFLELLENDVIASQLAADFDLIMVDEFQDTNPIQLALFQGLRKLAPRNRWVGDPKQAIYGFRDTDPKLIDEVWNQSSDAKQSRLPSNYRSQRGLVQLVGQLFEPIFGEEVHQKPVHSAADRGVERWLFDTTNQSDDATALACGISQLYHEGVRFGDILVLERTNRLLDPLTAALDSLGIPYLRESPGLLATREGAMVLAGLRLVLDRHDSLSAATILHLLGDPDHETPGWIEQRLREVRTAEAEKAANEDAVGLPPWSAAQEFARLETIDRALLSPVGVVHHVIEALDLPNLVPRWGDPARRCSNLDSMLRHAQTYEEDAYDRGQAVTLGGFILYLEHLSDEGLDVCYPPQGHDAVTLMTYHSSKGLEWPVVILSGLNSDRDPNLWSPVVTGGDIRRASPLEGRSLRAWTWPFGVSDGPFGGFRTGSGLNEDALESPEGEERRVREQEENLRLLYVGCTRAKQKLVFAHRQGRYAWLEQLPAVDEILDPNREEGEHSLSGIDTTYVIRRPNTDAMDACRFEPRSTQRWLALEPGSNQEFLPRFHSPSQAKATSEDVSFETLELPGKSYFPSGVQEDQYAVIGDAVHSYLASLPSTIASSDEERQIVAARCLSSFGASGLLSPDVLVSSGERFRKWIEDTFPGAHWHVESLLCGARQAGGHWNGTIDLMLQLSSGELVVIDHKSAPIRRTSCAAKAAQYAGQLSAYSEALESIGEHLDSTWIHFPLAGVVARKK